jgi:superfamily II DNA/RNA helicase
MLDILAGSRAKARMPRSLILEPTRELALQVAENFVKYGKHLNLTHALLIGGESMNDQRDVLEKGVDVLIATPGRLLDLFDRGRVLLADCKVLVIDEADRMLDMGFIPDVERSSSFCRRCARRCSSRRPWRPRSGAWRMPSCRTRRRSAVSAPASSRPPSPRACLGARARQARGAAPPARQEAVQNALIFCNRKVDVDILYKSLRKHGFSVGALHGDLDQSQRFATLNRFKAGDIKLLVCSDVAARGLDIGGLSHVFNFDVPFHAEDYVHRIGRTGRAGRQGNAFTLCMPEEARSLAAIEKLTGKPIPRMEIDGLDPVTPEEIAEGAKARRGPRRPARAERRARCARPRRAWGRPGRRARARRRAWRRPRAWSAPRTRPARGPPRRPAARGARGAAPRGGGRRRGAARGAPPPPRGPAPPRPRRPARPAAREPARRIPARAAR